MLEHHRVAATRGVEEAGSEVTVGEQHRHRTREHRHHRNQQVRGDEPCPYEQRHLHQRHARGAQVEDRRDDVDRSHDRRRAEDVHREDRKVHAHAGLNREWRVHGPATRGGTARHQE